MRTVWMLADCPSDVALGGSDCRPPFARDDDVLAAPHFVLTADAHGDDLYFVSRGQECLEVFFDGLSHFEIILVQLLSAAQNVLLKLQRHVEPWARRSAIIGRRHCALATCAVAGPSPIATIAEYAHDFTPKL